MTETKLLSHLKSWFENNESNKRKYSQSIIGKLIRDEIKKDNHWKERARWHPPSNTIELNIKKHQGLIPKKNEIKKDNDDW